MSGRLAVLPGFRSYLFLPFSPDSGGRLDCPRLTGFDVVPPTPQLSKQPRLLQLPLEQLERSFQAVLVTEPDFGHPAALVERKKKEGPASRPAPGDWSNIGPVTAPVWIEESLDPPRATRR